MTLYAVRVPLGGVVEDPAASDCRSNVDDARVPRCGRSRRSESACAFEGLTTDPWCWTSTQGTARGSPCGRCESKAVDSESAALSPDTHPVSILTRCQKPGEKRSKPFPLTCTRLPPRTYRSSRRRRRRRRRPRLAPHLLAFRPHAYLSLASRDNPRNDARPRDRGSPHPEPRPRPPEQVQKAPRARKDWPDPLDRQYHRPRDVGLPQERRTRRQRRQGRLGRRESPCKWCRIGADLVATLVKPERLLAVSEVLEPARPPN